MAVFKSLRRKHHSLGEYHNSSSSWEILRKMHGYFLKQICLHLKKYSQNGNLPQVGVNIMNITKYLNPPPRNQLWTVLWNTFQHLEPRHFHPKSLPVVFLGFPLPTPEFNQNKWGHKSFSEYFIMTKHILWKPENFFWQPPCPKGNFFDDVFWGFSLGSLKKNNEEQLS